MPAIRFRDLNASYTSWGTGPAIAMLHSGGSSSAQWTRIAEPIAASHSVIAPDLIGFGDTEAWPVQGDLTHDLQADLVAAVLQAAGAGQADIVGHSYGGATAIRLAIRRPDLVRSLVLIEPILAALLDESGDPLYTKSIQVARAFIAGVDAGRPETGWERFIDSRNGAGSWAALPDARKRRFLAQSARTKEGFISNLNNRTRLAECRALAVPTTIVCSEFAVPEDRRVTEILAATIPHARSVAIAEAGHMSPLTHPGALVAIILDHVARIQPQPGAAP